MQHATVQRDDDASWVVFGGGGPVCKRCNGHCVIKLPMSVTEWTQRVGAFVEEHRKCKDVISEEASPKLREFLKFHPLPWETQSLMIVDSNGNRVIHLGGLIDNAGRTIEGDYLVELNRLLVDRANSLLLERK